MVRSPRPSWLFKAELAQAIILGEKTETRRVVSPHTALLDGRPWTTGTIGLDWDGAFVDDGPSPAGNPGPYLRVDSFPGSRVWHRVYPRLSAMDLVYVREQHYLEWETPDILVLIGDEQRYCWVLYKSGEARLIDTSTSGVVDTDVWEIEEGAVRWRPSIYMPRWASRVTCLVLEVWIERIQDISDESIQAEGVLAMVGKLGDRAAYARYAKQYGEGYRAIFASGWEAINGPRGYGWDANPWVFAHRFRAQPVNIDTLLDARASSEQDEETQGGRDGNHE